MLRHGDSRIEAKRKNTINAKRKQFADAQYEQQDYPYRLSIYQHPPTAEITLEQFEQWAIDRLKVLAEIESCSFRRRTAEETVTHMTPLLNKYLPLSSKTSASTAGGTDRLKEERQKDHYSHFILRLAFSGTAELRDRFARNERKLFELRFKNDDLKERQAFVSSLDFDWEMVSAEERQEYAKELHAATSMSKKSVSDDGPWFKVDWERVPELVENRRVFIKFGKAYVPAREQLSMVLDEFSTRLQKALDLTARALPRMDEDDRLQPILEHLSRSFAMPDSTLADAESAVPGAEITRHNIDGLARDHFPMCMKNLHTTLRKDSHLKHYGRLQYTLFLKGIGMSLDECLLFWRQAFKNKTDDQFNKDYRYNVKHSYGEVGGDANRRGKGYTPYSCQKILSEAAPGPGQTHGCPYKHFSVNNLTALLQASGIHDDTVLKDVRQQVTSQRYHIACNTVFDWTHKNEIIKAKADGSWSATDLEVIVHPNTYYKRSYLLKNGMKSGEDGEAMEM